MLNEIENDVSIRVIVIRGSGPGFCAGADLIETSAEDIPIQLEMNTNPFLRKL